MTTQKQTEQKPQDAKTEKPTTAITPVTIIRNLVCKQDIRSRFEDMLGKRASSFCGSLINLVKNEASLQKCTPDSIMTSALIAASMNLPLDKNLGYAAITPYKLKQSVILDGISFESKAEFQIMYKGIIQLCIRSGQYAKINNAEIYTDEFKNHNPITGEIEFTPQTEWKLRAQVNPEGIVDLKNVAGAYAMFRLISGFEASAYMRKEELLAHGRRFSKAFQYDIEKNRRTSLWSLDPVSMFRKTVLKLLLLKFGPVSIEMQEVFAKESESDFVDAAQNVAATIANQMGSQVTETDFETKQPAALPANTENQTAREEQGLQHREPGDDSQEDKWLHDQ